MGQLTLLWGLLLAPVIYATHHEAPSSGAQTTITSEAPNHKGFTYEAPQTLSGLPFDDVAVLAHLLYTEVRGEDNPEVAMRAVGEVVLTRVDSSRFPNTLHEVVWQPSNNPSRPRACQFSAFCDPSVDLRMMEVAEAGLAFKVAEQLLTGFYGHLEIVHESDHFLKCSLTGVRWKDTMEFKSKVGQHCFYKEGKRT